MRQFISAIAIVTSLFAMSCNSNDSTNVHVEQLKNDSTINQNRLEIYAFHGTRQCETCKNMKANTKATLDKYFIEELKSGKIIYQVIDVDDSKNEKLAEKFEATGTALMVNKVVNSKDSIVDWSDFAFDKANDETIFIPELKTKIESILK